MIAICINCAEPELGDEEAARFELAGRDAVVGRDSSCDILLETASISGRHGVFRLSGGAYSYTDLASSNGSAWVRDGHPAVRIAAGSPVILEDGDALLLGGLQAPVRMVVTELGGSSAEVSGGMPARTVVASAPIADLLGPSGVRGAGRGAGALVALAARCTAAESAQGICEAALSYLHEVAPLSEHHGVLIWGAGVGAGAGAPLPAGLKEQALKRRDVICFEDDGPALPQTASLVAAGVRGALVAPLVAGVSGEHPTIYGVIAAWTAIGSAALPLARLDEVGAAAALLGLTAAQWASRAEGLRRRQALEKENTRLRGGRQAPTSLAPIGSSPAFVAAISLARRVASADVPVVIHGETGTGKEVVARSMHGWSRREAGSFVAFNCAAVPEALVESELFGHKRGAFTGATADRKGLFEQAHGGTIFLDEIGEMPPSMQAKLLRVLQDREVRPVGSSVSKVVDVRVLSATHQDLQSLVDAGRFRADLMYRLNAVALTLPPLRERGDDVALLAHFLLGKACDRAQRKISGFSGPALWALSMFPWPGNVRQLENEVMRAVALTADGETIQAAAFSPAVADSAPAEVVASERDRAGPPRTLKEQVMSAERHAVQSALAHSNGNVSQAARDLGLTRPGLYKVMGRLGLR